MAENLSVLSNVTPGLQTHIIEGNKDKS